MSPPPPRSLLFLVCAIAFLLHGCGRREEPPAAIQRFCELIKAGKTSEAYASAAFGFRSQQSEKVFEATVREMGLTRMTGLKSEVLENDGRSAKVRTDIFGDANNLLPLIITLTAESGQWRIFSLTSPRNAETGLVENRFSLVGKTSSFIEAVDRPMPPEAEVRRLSKEALLEFNRAILTDSFDPFFNYIAVSWQRQVTPGQVQRAFRAFMEKKVNLSAVQGQELVFDPAPHINTQGLLEVIGTFKAPPYRAAFNLQFVYELPKWKLFGIDVRLQELPAATP